MAELVEAAERIPAERVVYGAGLENRPDLVARLAAGRTLLGCTPETLRRVRDPALLGAALRAAGLAYPRTLPAAEARAGRSRAPLAAQAGARRRRPRGARLARRPAARRRHRPGAHRRRACSAAAVADGRSAALLGVSEQLIGRRTLGARGYAWCGNVAPPRLPAASSTRWPTPRRRSARTSPPRSALRGVFGVDFVWDGARAWVVEVNPRPTASLETIDAAYGVRSFAAHLEACAGRLPAGAAGADRPARPARRCSSRRGRCASPDTRDWTARGIRDVPHPGEQIAAGHPICTLSRRARARRPCWPISRLAPAALRAELHDRWRVDAVA